MLQAGRKWRNTVNALVSLLFLRDCEAESSEGIDRAKLGQRTRCEQLNDSQTGVYMYDNGDVKLAHALFFLFLSPRGHSH